MKYVNKEHPECIDCGSSIPEGGSYITADYGDGLKEYCLPCNRKLASINPKKAQVGKDEAPEGSKDRNNG